MYQVRRVHIGKTDQLDELAHECGRLYSQTLVSFWRTVRHKGIWLQPKHLMRWYPSDKLHAHTADACVQAFFASLRSWRERRKAGQGTSVSVPEVWMDLPSGWSWSHEHQVQVSWGIWCPPRCCGHGTRRGHTASAAYPRSS